MSHHSEHSRRVARLSADVTCNGKHPFESHQLAQQVATRSNRHRKNAMTAYRCPHCHHWHLGTNKGRTKAHRRHDFNQQREEELV